MCYVYFRQIQPGVPLWGPHSDTLGFFWRHPWRVIQDYKGFCCASSSSLLSWNIKPLIPSQNLRFFHPLECNRCLAIRFLWLWSSRFLATLNKAFLRSNFPLLCQIPDLIYNRHSINICGFVGKMNKYMQSGHAKAIMTLSERQGSFVSL